MSLQENNHIAIIDGDDRHGQDAFLRRHRRSRRASTPTEDGALRFTEQPDRRQARARRRASGSTTSASSPPTKATTRAARAASPSSTRTAPSITIRGAAFEHARGGASATIPRAAPTPRASSRKALEVATFGGDELHLRRSASAARSSASTSDTGGEPDSSRSLPSGIGPESAVAIPARNLLVTANETDLARRRARRARMS